MKLNLFLISILFFSFASSIFGALGLKTLSDCAPLINVGSKMECYHAAAMSVAYTGRCDSAYREASSICSRIYGEFGRSNDDIASRAELESNNCFLDIARISGQDSICYNIQSQRSFGSALVGEGTTRQMCLDLAQKSRIRDQLQQNYNSSNGICALIYILPLFVGFVFLKSKN
jgi:hypothetical protein